MNVLTATLATPATFTAGYTVTLHNHSAATVRLTPCPSCTEYLGVSCGPGKSRYLAR